MSYIDSLELHFLEGKLYKSLRIYITRNLMYDMDGKTEVRMWC